MTPSPRAILAPALLAATVLVPTAAHTFNLLKPVRHWASVPVQVCVVGPGHASITADDPDRGLTATIQALNGTHPNLDGTGWNGVAAVGPVIDAVSCNTTWRLADGIPTIAFNEMITGTCVGSCLAATFTGFYHCDPALPDGHCVVDDADVETRKNKADRYGGPFYSLYETGCTRGKEWSLEAVMVHEAGHQLGIGHTDVVGATMYPSLPSCNPAAATIENDDISALDVLY